MVYEKMMEVAKHDRATPEYVAVRVLTTTTEIQAFYAEAIAYLKKHAVFPDVKENPAPIVRDNIEWHLRDFGDNLVASHWRNALPDLDLPAIIEQEPVVLAHSSLMMPVSGHRHFGGHRGAD